MSTQVRSSTPIEREEFMILQQLSPPSSPPMFDYRDFFEFVLRIKKLSLPSCWHIKTEEHLVTVICTSDSNCHLLPKFEIFVDQSLSYSVRVFGWMLSDDHHLYMSNGRSFHNVTLSNINAELNTYDICDGIKTPNPDKEVNFQKHVVPKR